MDKITFIGGELDGLTFDIADNWVGHWPFAITFDMPAEPDLTDPAKIEEPVTRWRLLRYTFATGGRYAPNSVWAEYHLHMSRTIDGCPLSHWDK